MTARSLQPIRFWFAIIGTLCLLLIVPAAVLADSGALVVGPSQQVRGDIATVAQPIEIAGTVDGDVTSWSGDIAVTGRVNGDVVSYTGDVEIAAGAHIAGSIMSVSGNVQRHAQAEVARAEIGGHGNQALTSLVGLMLPPSQIAPGAAPMAGAVLLSVVAAVLLSAATLLLGAFWPNRTLASAITLRVFPARSLIIGMLATLTLAVLVPPAFGLLAASMLGLPMLIVALVIINLPYVYGLATIARFIAFANRQVARPPALLPPSAMLVVVAVAAVVALATSMSPILGLLTFYLLASPGLGAVLLSRGGLLAPVKRLGARR